MRNLLKRLGEMGKTIIVSSHILPELADVCNKIGIIDRGVMHVNADVANVMKQIRRSVELRVEVIGDAEAAAQLLQQDEHVERVSVDKGRLTVTMKEGSEDYSHLATQLIHRGFELKTFHENVLDLEAAFMALTKGLGKNI